ncbi:DUF4856 domain-containing protein [Aureispira anguillae]|uniref:DUF4856 domain-containing protein n=1 Tax=Aureispira anguillae TaxID=2864201 RepID=A0A915VK51_9BACT|nr:DUF4856 domain-containing protein [Aureispira anguillae]BDS09476.1 DUF4856 domain-containing protein [Aureispira anguillae]
MKFSSNHLLSIGAALAIGLTSCQPEDTSYTVPTTYNFENVSYTGQQNRLDMMGEITSYIKTAHASNAPALDAAKIKDMYGDNTGNHFSTTDLNGSSKQLKDKTITTEQTNFEAYMDAVAVASQSTNAAAANGHAGIGSNNAGSKNYLFNANGIELTQVIEKGLMGACFYYQATAVYMGDGKMNVDNNLVNAGKGTNMEHHWDEAFGYFGVPTDFPTTTTGVSFWGKYCNKHEAVYPLNEKMMNAFLKGRAAISAKDIATRDEQITILRKNWELVTVATSIYYLNKAANNISTDVFAAYHELSEVFGFIMSIKYGAGTGAITDAQVNTILTDLFGNSDPLQANNYNVTTAKIEAAKTALVGYFTDLENVKDTL